MKPASKTKEHVSKILEVGKEKGYITYKQVNDILPDEVVSSEEIDDILLMLGENDIKIVEQEEKVQSFRMMTKKRSGCTGRHRQGGR